jgi:hypothetical protein
MKLFTSGRYAAIASTAALVVALGGTSYAASQITSNDIKDGTIQTKDLAKPTRISVKSAHNDNGTTMTGSDKTVLSINVKPGKYVVNAKAVAFYTTTGAYASCSIVAPNGSTVDTSWWYAGPSGDGYGTLANQAVFTVGNVGTVQLNCSGGSSTLSYKKLTVQKVHTLVDLNGPNVAKAPLPRHLAS